MTRPGQPPETPHYQRALRQAAEWRVRLDEPEPGDQEAFERWRDQHPDHRRAWRSLDATWQSLEDAARPGTRAALEHTLHDERRARRRWLGTTLAVLGLVALVPMGWELAGLGHPAHLLADRHTAPGEREQLTLPDGSVLTLDTATAVDIDYRDDRRVIHLRDGGLKIVVAPDANRPLEVLTPEGRARALGTQFTARRFDRHGDTYLGVTVLESHVELCPRSADGCLTLAPDQQAKTTRRRLGAARPVDAAARAAWAQGQLVVDDKPLADVLGTLGRYHRGVLRYDPAELAGLRVSGVLPLDDIDLALKALAQSQPLAVQRYTPWVVIVARAP